MISMLLDTYPTEDDALSDALSALSGVGTLILFLLAIAVYVVTALALQRLFRRAEYPHPWAAWIPFWNQWVLFELGAQHGAWSLLSLAPILSAVPILGTLISLAANVILIVVTVFSAMNINKAVGREPLGWTVLAVFLPSIWIWIIGFSTHPFSGARRTGPYFWGSPFTPSTPNTRWSSSAGPQNGQYPPTDPSQPYPPAQPQNDWHETLPAPPAHPQYGAQTPDGNAPTSNPTLGSSSSAPAAEGENTETTGNDTPQTPENPATPPER